MPIEDHQGRSPTMAASAWVAPTATIRGDVTLGEHVGIWYSAVIRTEEVPIRVGDGTNIQDGCIVHADPGYPTTIGARVSVGHAAILHGCTIADDVLVGMGAIVLNGAVIGERSIIGAGTLIPQGMVVPPESLVIGSPGRVRRATTAAEHERIALNAEVYIQRKPG